MPLEFDAQTLASADTLHVIIRLNERWRGTQSDELKAIDRIRGHLERVLNSPAGALELQDRDQWSKLSAALPTLQLRPLLSEAVASSLSNRLRAANHSSWVARYLTFDVPSGIEIKEIVALTNSLSFVERAYVEPPGSDPHFVPNDTLAGNQGYLDPAPIGIDAKFIWDEMLALTEGLPGANVGLVDLEQGWTLNHEDLPAGIQLLGTGTILNSSRSHGTNSLGIIGAVANNALGCIGIAPAITSLNVVSTHGSTRLTALHEATNALNTGDVLLIESQLPSFVGGKLIPLAIEIDPDLRQAIQNAVALGIIVIEAAGNAGTDLGIVTTDSGEDFSIDSGAVIVSAATSTAPHTLLPASNYGAPISCYAWGENVTTCSSDPGGATNLYGPSYNTSAASAIVAGAAVALQSLHVAVNRAPMTPAQLRHVFRTQGTPPAASETRAMGVMPDLKKIATALLLTWVAHRAPGIVTGVRIIK